MLIPYLPLRTLKKVKFLDDIYGDEILIVPYVMPGFVLAKK